MFLSAADHPHRDAACATLAWLAEAEGRLFECYYDARPTGSHYGGGLPAHGDPNDLRGGTFTGAHHLEQLLLLLQRFDCQVASLGSSLLDPILANAGVTFLTKAGELTTFYAEIFGASDVPLPNTLLVVGRGKAGGTSLVPYAFPEIVGRRVLAMSEGDGSALDTLAAARSVETLWCRSYQPVAHTDLRPEHGSDIAVETGWMADRWESWRRGFLLGDPELAGRWIPTAVRNRWVAIHGDPQSAVVHRLSRPLGTVATVFGRQQDDRDFLELSRLGVSFQLVDPGRPPFPILREAQAPWPAAPAVEEPDDDELRAWARRRVVVSTLLFWTGMARELESLYPLADVLGLTGLRAGLALTTESFAGMWWPPLTLTRAAREIGGLSSQVELLLASAGTGAMIESEAPLDRFAATLRDGVEQLALALGNREAVPRGWWPVMDARLVPAPLRRVEADTTSPFVHIRYQPRQLGSPAASRAGGGSRPSVRGLVRQSPLRHLFEPLRPFSEYRPGAPGHGVLTAVRNAGFEYAFTTSSFSGPPSVVTDVPGLTALTFTAGRWDGWTPFITVHDVADLQHAERRLLKSRRPGWLIGTLDTCLWAFTGPVWQRGGRLYDMCKWMAAGGSSGRLINVTPRTAARYARVLAESARVGRLASS